MLIFTQFLDFEFRNILNFCTQQLNSFLNNPRIFTQEQPLHQAVPPSGLLTTSYVAYAFYIK